VQTLRCEAGMVVGVESSCDWPMLARQHEHLKLKPGNSLWLTFYGARESLRFIQRIW
jgi:hypothetical protein